MALWCWAEVAKGTEMAVILDLTSVFSWPILGLVFLNISSLMSHLQNHILRTDFSVIYSISLSTIYLRVVI